MAENNNTLLEKLDGLVARFEEVSTLITDPARQMHKAILDYMNSDAFRPTANIAPELIE